MIGMRLREERERLGYTQPAFAELAGAKKRTLIDWEKGVSSPTAVQLARLSEAGVDALYVVTGTRAIPVEDTLSPRERALLDNYRHTSPDNRKFIENAAVLTPKLQLAKNLTTHVPTTRPARTAQAT